MGGRGKPAADAVQSIVMCSDVQCTCMYVFLLFLISVTAFSRIQSQTFHHNCRFAGGKFQLVFLNYLIQQLKVLLNNIWIVCFSATSFKFVRFPKCQLRMSLSEPTPPVFTRTFLPKAISFPTSNGYGPGKRLCEGSS